MTGSDMMGFENAISYQSSRSRSPGGEPVGGKVVDTAERVDCRTETQEIQYQKLILPSEVGVDA